jgi:hypothetical protein
MNTIPRAAGRAAGTIARALIWAYHEIDWAEVAALVIACLTALAILTLLAGRACRRAWDGLPGMSEALGRWYAAMLVGATPAPAVAPAPVVHPLAALASGLEQLSCRELRELLGTRRRPAKRELIATALAWVAV